MNALVHSTMQWGPTALGTFQSTKMLESTPEAPGPAAVPGEVIWHLMVYSFGFALLKERGSA